MKPILRYRQAGRPGGWAGPEPGRKVCLFAFFFQHLEPKFLRVSSRGFLFWPNQNQLETRVYGECSQRWFNRAIFTLFLDSCPGGCFLNLGSSSSSFGVTIVASIQDICYVLRSNSRQNWWKFDESLCFTVNECRFQTQNWKDKYL